jgi:hypothetical protein
VQVADAGQIIVVVVLPLTIMVDAGVVRVEGGANPAVRLTLSTDTVYVKSPHCKAKAGEYKNKKPSIAGMNLYLLNCICFPF